MFPNRREFVATIEEELVRRLLDGGDVDLGIAFDGSGFRLVEFYGDEDEDIWPVAILSVQERCLRMVEFAHLDVETGELTSPRLAEPWRSHVRQVLHEEYWRWSRNAATVAVGVAEASP